MTVTMSSVPSVFAAHLRNAVPRHHALMQGARQDLLLQSEVQDRPKCWDDKRQAFAPLTKFRVEKRFSQVPYTSLATRV